MYKFSFPPAPFEETSSSDAYAQTTPKSAYLSPPIKIQVPGYVIGVGLLTLNRCIFAIFSFRYPVDRKTPLRYRKEQ